MEANDKEKIKVRRFYIIAAIVILCSSVIAGTFLYVNSKYRPLEKPVIGMGFIDIVNESSPDFPKVYLQPEKIEIDPNETAVVNVILVNGSSVAVVDVGMEYDGSVVEVIDISSKYRFNYSKGYIHNRFILNYLEIKIFFEKPVKNNGIIANITLKGLSDGKTAMGFSDLSGLYDKKGVLMNRELWGTEITVGTPPSDEIHQLLQPFILRTKKISAF